MSTALISGLTGLRSFQRMIDVIGNNLANSSTVGFKSSRVLFSDLVSRMLQPGSAPSGNMGGTNPMQIGQGVGVSSIDINLSQGALLGTGRVFDLGLNGEGYFALSDGSNNYYTRVGSFDLDRDGNLVDVRSGMHVLDPTGTAIQIDLDRIDPPSASTEVEFARTLPAKVEGPLSEILTTSSPFNSGTTASVTGGSGDPPGSGSYTFAGNEEITFLVNGASQGVTFNNAGSMTIAQIAAEIMNQTTGLEARDDGGVLVVETQRKGSQARLQIRDDTGQMAATMGIASNLVLGTDALAEEDTDLNELTSNLAGYSIGDQVQISGLDADGNPVGGTFTYGAANDGTSLGDLRDYVSGLFDGATASIDPAGNLVLRADETGEAELSLILTDATSNSTGSTTWSQHSFGVTTEGKGPDEVVTSIEVYDSQGLAHTVTFRFERTSESEWDLHAELPSGDGTLLDSTVNGITFGHDGTLQGISGSQTISIQWDGLAAAQDISIDLGSPGSLGAVTQIGDTGTAYASDQDGYSVGTLESLSVDADGLIEGFYSNRQVREMSRVGVAVFSNPAGLTGDGDTTFRVSAASGNAAMRQAASGGVGSIASGSLENSNVDMAEEFIHLIEAQRGFQASARVITASDELLAEVVNLV